MSAEPRRFPARVRAEVTRTTVVPHDKHRPEALPRTPLPDLHWPLGPRDAPEEEHLVPTPHSADPGL